MYPYDFVSMQLYMHIYQNKIECCASSSVGMSCKSDIPFRLAGKMFCGDRSSFVLSENASVSVLFQPCDFFQRKPWRLNTANCRPLLKLHCVYI